MFLFAEPYIQFGAIFEKLRSSTKEPPEFKANVKKSF